MAHSLVITARSCGGKSDYNTIQIIIDIFNMSIFIIVFTFIIFPCDNRQQTRRQTADKTADSRQQTADSRQQTAD
jgi:glutathione peroxidase-family protein